MIHQPKVRFVEKGRRLQRVTGAFTAQVEVCLAMKFFINERKEFIESLVVSVAPVTKQPRYPVNIIHRSPLCARLIQYHITHE
jgi:hypothetical protein